MDASEGQCTTSLHRNSPGILAAFEWGRRTVTRWEVAPRALWIAVLLGVCALTLFANLGGRDLWGNDEARHAQRAREMLASGQWLTPTYLGQPDFDKPPVHYWLMVSAARLWGVNDWVFCLPSALFGTITVLVTFALGVACYGVAAGGMAAFVLATAFLFPYYARMAYVDVPLVACFTAAIWVGRGAVLTDRRWGGRVLGAAILLAAGAMLKGLVGLLLPALILGLGEPVPGRWRRLAVMVGLAVGIAAPLYIALGPGFTGRFLIVDHLQRFFVRSAELGGVYPWYFYGPTLCGNFLPWTVLLPAVVATVIGTRDGWRRWRLPLVWVGVTFLLLSLGANKRDPYLLPLFPGLALLVGAVADEVLAGRAPQRVWPWWRAGVAALGLGLGAAALGLPWLWPAHLGAFSVGAGHLLLAALGGCVVWRSWNPKHRLAAACGAGILVLGASQVLVWQALPAMNGSRSARAAAGILRAAARFSPVAVVGRDGVDAGLVYYLDLPPSQTIRVAPGDLPDALRKGWQILAARTALPPAVLASMDVVIRAHVRLRHTEYFLLEQAGAGSGPPSDN